MKKIKLLFSLLLLSASLLSQTPVSRAILNSLWKNRVVPPLTDVSTTFASLYNIVDDGAPALASRTLTINGTAFDLSADRTWTVGDVLSASSYSNPSWIASLAWSKITSTPTTLSGYGITDAITSASAALTYLPYSYTASPTWSGIVTTNSTTSTSTVSGTSWYDGVGSGKNGFNFYSNDASNLGNTFNFGNGTNNLSLYQDHGTNNWLYVPLGSNFVVSVDGGGSQAYEIDKTQQSWTVGTSTTGTGTTYLWSAANNTGQTASTEEVYFKYAPRSIQYNAGALATHRAFFVGQQTIKFVSSSTLIEGTNAYIESALVAGTNAGITNSSGLMIGGMSGTTSVGSGVTNSYGLSVFTPTGATNNYAARFMQGNVGIGTSAPASALDVNGTMNVSGASTFLGSNTLGTVSSSNIHKFYVGSATTASVTLQGLVGTTIYPAMYFGGITPSPTNYALVGLGSTTGLNSTGNTELRVSGSTIVSATLGGVTTTGTSSISGTANFGADVKLSTVGNGIYIKEGSNATMGMTAITYTTGGSPQDVVVNTTKTTANSRIFLTVNSGDATFSNIPIAFVLTRTAGTSFTIRLTADAAAVTYNIAWMIIEPN